MPTAKSLAVAAEKEMQKDEATILAIKGLGFLIAQMKASGLGTAARILDTAREDLVHWAAQLDFVESPEDAFIFRHLYDSGLFPAAELAMKIAAIRDPAARKAALDVVALAKL